jgi:hypothetical protein
MAICVLGCAIVPPPGTIPCYFLCIRLVGSAVATALKECTYIALGCMTGVTLVEISCYAGCP